MTARREVVILVEGPALTVTRSRYAGGERGPDPHVHREHTDAFSVLEGELTGFAAFLRTGSAWDSFDAPADGGLPADGVVVTRTPD